MRRARPLVLLLVALACLGCGKGDQREPATAQGRGAKAPAAKEAAPAASAPPTEETRHRTQHDPNAFYTLADVPSRGSYGEIAFTQLKPEQINRAVHRLRTEYCTCGCEKDTIDECLINDPQCQVAITLARQVVREERVR